MKMVTRSVYVLLFYILFAPVPVSAQPQWVNFTTNELYIKLLFQGDKAWYSSRGGLALINRPTHEVKVYTAANSNLPSNFISEMVLGPDGVPWLMVRNNWGTFADGQFTPINNVYEGKEVTFQGSIQFGRFGRPLMAGYYFEDELPKRCIFRLSTDGALSIVFRQEDLGIGGTFRTFLLDGEGRILILSGGLVMVDNGEMTVFDDSNSPFIENTSRSLSVSPDGEIFVVQTQSGLFGMLSRIVVHRYNDSGWSTTSKSLVGIVSDDTSRLSSRFFGPDGALWMCTDQGDVFRLEDGDITEVDWPTLIDVEELEERELLGIDASGRWWFHSDHFHNRRLYRYEGERSEFYEITSTALYSNIVRAVHADAEGSVWAASSFDLAAFDGQHWKNYYPGMPASSTEDIASDKEGNIWLSDHDFFSDRTFLKYDGEEWTAIKLGQIVVREFFFDMEGMLWGATNNGVIHYDGQNWSFFNAANSIVEGSLRTIAQQSDTTFYCASFQTLYFYDGSDFQQLPDFGLNSEAYTIFHLFVDDLGRLWISHAEGVAIYQNGVYEDWTGEFPEEVLGGVSKITQDTSGAYWFATSSGLLKYSGEVWTLFDEGVSIGYLRDMAVDAYGNIWLATSQDGIAVSNENGIKQLGRPLQACMKGRIVADANQNGAIDGEDSPLSKQKLILLPEEQITVTDENGGYRFSIPEEGVKTVQLASDAYLWELSSDSLSYTRMLTDSCIEGLDFALRPASQENGGKLIINSASPRCGGQGAAWLTVNNTGQEPLSGTVALELDEATTLVDYSVVPDNYAGNTFYWSFWELPPSASINIKMTVEHPEEGTVDSLHLEGKLFGENGEILDQHIQASSFQCGYDPNRKTVHSSGMELDGFVEKGEDLIYTINFDNQCLDTVYRVTIRDELDSWLDVSTLALLASSHPVRLELIGHQLTLAFDQIKLPPAASSPNTSQGFVQFRIRPKTDTPDGQRIENLALIYFDYNVPTVTNTVEAFIVDQLSSTDTEAMRAQHPCMFLFAPNPVSTSTVAQVPAPFLGGRFELYDMRGQLLVSHPIRSELLEWERQGLPTGMYFYRMAKGERSCSGKLLLR